MTEKNLKIARQLVRLAKSLVTADDSSSTRKYYRVRAVNDVSASFVHFELIVFDDDETSANTIMDDCIDEIVSEVKAKTDPDKITINIDHNCWNRKAHDGTKYCLKQFFFDHEPFKNAGASDEFDERLKETNKAVDVAKRILRKEGFRYTRSEF